MNELEQITAALVGAGHREYKVDEVLDVIPDAPTFGDITRSIPKEDAARKYAETAEILQGMLTVNEGLHAVDEAQHNGVTRAQDARAELRKEQAVQSVEECKQALEERADWTELASVWAEREEQIRFLNVVVEYGQQVLIPASRLSLLESDYQMASMHARLLTWKAIVAGIERYEASKALQDVDWRSGIQRRGPRVHLASGVSPSPCDGSAGR